MTAHDRLHEASESPSLRTLRANSARSTIGARPGRARRFASLGESRRRPARLPRALGWFSIALGLTEIAAPRAIAKAIGIGERNGSDGLSGLLGLRDLSRRAPWGHRRGHRAASGVLR